MKTKRFKMPNKQNYEKITLAATTLNDPTKMKIMEYSGDPHTGHSITEPFELWTFTIPLFKP